MRPSDSTTARIDVASHDLIVLPAVERISLTVVVQDGDYGQGNPLRSPPLGETVYILEPTRVRSMIVLRLG